MSKTSAPGPNGITLRHLSKMDPKYSQTVEIFNLLLASGMITDMVKGFQTVLIPKSAKPEFLRDINN